MPPALTHGLRGSQAGVSVAGGGARAPPTPGQAGCRARGHWHVSAEHTHWGPPPHGPRHTHKLWSPPGGNQLSAHGSWRAHLGHSHTVIPDLFQCWTPSERAVLKPTFWGFPWRSVVKTPCRGHRVDPWSGN